MDIFTSYAVAKLHCPQTVLEQNWYIFLHFLNICWY